MNLYLADSGGIFRPYLHTKGGEGDANLLRLENFPIEKSGADGEIFRGANILQSFYYADEFTEKEIIPKCKTFMLDSGAFSFKQNPSVKLDWDAYVDRYTEFINRNKVNLFFEMDIDKVIGLKEVEKLRAKIERQTGRQPIPVFHKSRGKDYFVYMCKNYPYVALGGIAKEQRLTGDRLKAVRWFIETAHEHDAKIHALGFTYINALPIYHFDSVDSTAWTSGNRFGSIYKFNGKTLEVIKKPDGKRMANHKAIARHNFLEWQKFARYAETHF